MRSLISLMRLIFPPPRWVRSGVPTQPQDATARGLDRQVRLAWDPPATTGGAAITDYVVRYRLQGTTAWVRFQDGVSVALLCQVTGLQNRVAYEFQVAAKNPRGFGVWSPVLEATPGA